MNLCLLRIFILLFLLMNISEGRAQFTIFYTQNSSIPDNAVRCITPDARDSSIWIGTDWGLAHFTDNSWQIFQTSNSGLPDDYVRSVAIEENGNIWVGTFLNGFTIFDGTQWISYNEANSRLPSNQVRNIAFDTTGHAWIGTGGGLVYIADTGMVVYNMNNSPLGSNNIASLYIDAFNTKWVGTINGGLALIEDTTWTIYKRNNSSIADNTILDIDEDTSGNLWMATPAAGIMIFNRSVWNFFTPLNSSLLDYSVNSIALNQNNQCYIAMKQEGFSVYSGGLQWASYDTSNSNLPQNELTTTVVDHSGNIWVGTESEGLLQFDISTGIQKTISMNWNIYPNPATDRIIIKGQNIETSKIRLLNVQGETLSNSLFTDINTSLVTINTSQIPLGIYMLEIVSGNNVHAQRVVKF